MFAPHPNTSDKAQAITAASGPSYANVAARPTPLVRHDDFDLPTIQKTKKFIVKKLHLKFTGVTPQGKRSESSLYGNRAQVRMNWATLHYLAGSWLSLPQFIVIIHYLHAVS